MADQVELKQVLGAMIFAARQPLTVGAMQRTLAEAAQTGGGEALAFRSVKEADIRNALNALRTESEQNRSGFHLTESAEGYRFQSDAASGPWVRQMLEAGKPARLSRPALETLAIVAYRQPATRAMIEGVRGVAVDHILHLLMEMQLIRIVGRSELPGRPMLFGTTSLFMEHFGLKSLKELPGIEELARIEAVRQQQQAADTPEQPDAGAAPAAGADLVLPAAAAEEAGPPVEN